jgi:hypothetical protein
VKKKFRVKSASARIGKKHKDECNNMVETMANIKRMSATDTEATNRINLEQLERRLKRWMQVGGVQP